MTRYEILDKNGKPLIEYPGDPKERITAVVESVFFEKSGELVIVLKLPDYENPPEPDYPDW